VQLGRHSTFNELPSYLRNNQQVHLESRDADGGIGAQVQVVKKILAALAALEVDDINRFSHPGKLCAYAGLVPSTYVSGGKVHHGRLLPSCNRWLRWAYVETAWIAQHSSPYCRTYFERIKRRKGANSANTALARRLCEITWHCLTHNRPYEERASVRMDRSCSVAF